MIYDGFKDSSKMREIFTPLLCLAFFGAMMNVSTTLSAADQEPSGKLRFYIGTYNSPKSRGIYRSELDLATGKIAEPVLAVEAESPSFVAIHPSQKFLYAVNESAKLEGSTGGAVAAYAIGADGQLKFLNQKSSGGAAPCHLIVDPAGKHVLVANYSGGNASVLPIQPDGTLGDRTGYAQHAPVPRPGKTKAPLAHSINLDPSARFAFVCDAGVDQVFIYKYDMEKGTLTPNDPLAGLTAHDAAPRHFAMHPNGRQCYAINEAELSVTVFDFNAQTGALNPVQTISTVPMGIDRAGCSTAEVVVHPSGKFLYGSNRGFDTIAGFLVNPANGLLTTAGQFGKGLIKTPRNFNIDPSGTYLLAEGQDSDNIVVFRINPETGELTPTGAAASVGRPVCIRFMKP